MKYVLIVIALLLSGCITVQVPPPAAAVQTEPQVHAVNGRPRALFFLTLCAVSYHSGQGSAEKDGKIELAAQLKARADWYASKVGSMAPTNAEVNQAIADSAAYVKATTDFTVMVKACGDFYDANVGEWIVNQIDKGAFILGLVVGLVWLYRKPMLDLVARRGYVHPLVARRTARSAREEQARRRDDKHFRTHTWFAWYPVSVYDWGSNKWVTCWLMDVKRRRTGWPPQWEYWID